MSKTTQALLVVLLIAVIFVSAQESSPANTDGHCTDTASCSGAPKTASTQAARRHSPFGGLIHSPFDSLFQWPTFDLFEPFYHPAWHGSQYLPNNHVSKDLSLTNMGAVDVVEKENEFLILADAPGMTSKDVNVEIKGDTIMLSGKRDEEHRSDDNSNKLHRVERKHTSFSRSFRVPKNADVSQVSASCKEGVLKVVLPKIVPKQADADAVKVHVH
jgi:HSP20 family molecular chaperone IbpA